MGRSVVDGVDSNCIDAQLLEFRDVSLAAVDVGNGIGHVGGATGLVVDATNVETVVASKESYNGVSTRIDAPGDT